MRNLCWAVVVMCMLGAHRPCRDVVVCAHLVGRRSVASRGGVSVARLVTGFATGAVIARGSPQDLGKSVRPGFRNLTRDPERSFGVPSIRTDIPGESLCHHARSSAGKKCY